MAPGHQDEDRDLGHNYTAQQPMGKFHPGAQFEGGHGLTIAQRPIGASQSVAGNTNNAAHDDQQDSADQGDQGQVGETLIDCRGL